MNFDFRELVGDLVSLVKDRAKDVGQSRSAVQPSAEQIELAVLSAIAESPKNASEIVTALSLAGAGVWAPSGGKIHPTLTKLTEDKKVSAKAEGDRKVYSITKAGKSAIEDAAKNPATETASNNATGPARNLLTCDMSLLKSASKLGPAMLDVAQTGTREQQQAVAAALDELRNKLHAILAEK